MSPSTPMNTPSSEKPLFSFCVRIVWSARRSASNSGMSGGLELVAGDEPVAQRHNARRVGGDVVFVCPHHDRLPLGVQLPESRHDLGAGGGIELPRALVRQQNGRVV